MFKVVSGHQLYWFPPCIRFKRRQGTRQFHPKKFFQVNAKTNKYSNAVLLHVQSDTGNLYKVVSLKSSQWRLSKRPSWAIFKNANPELFIITIFIHSTFAPWLYLNTSTCTITHPPWWEIPFADNTIRIRIRITEGLPAKFHAFNRKWTIEAHICSALSKIIFKRVRGWTLGRYLSVQNFVEYPPIQTERIKFMITLSSVAVKFVWMSLHRLKPRPNVELFMRRTKQSDLS